MGGLRVVGNGAAGGRSERSAAAGIRGQVAARRRGSPGGRPAHGGANRGRSPGRGPDGREAALEVLKRPGKTPDAPDRPDAGDEPAVRLLDRLYDKLSYRDRGTVITGRIAFYGGLVLVFAAGVLLYRRTPESNRGTW